MEKITNSTRNLVLGVKEAAHFTANCAKLAKQVFFFMF